MPVPCETDIPFLFISRRAEGEGNICLADYNTQSSVRNHQQTFTIESQ